MVINGKALLHFAPIKDMKFAKLTAGPTTYGLGEAGYDIRIKQHIKFKPMEAKNWKDTSSFSPNIYFPHHFIDGERKEGNFCLASAIEEFDMPPDLVGIVHDKSSWAREGLSVFNTVIEPGWKGFLTLELVYNGPKELIIPAGCGIAQVVFHKTEEARAYRGRYQNQENKPVPAIKA